MLTKDDPIYGERLTHKSLTAFLKSHGLSYSVGNKADKIELINKNIENCKINIEEVNEWINRDLLYEGNKHVYILPHDGYNIADIDSKLTGMLNKKVHYYDAQENSVTLILKEKKYKAKYDLNTGKLQNTSEVYYLVVVEILSDIAIVYIDIPTLLFNGEPPSTMKLGEELCIKESKLVAEYIELISQIFEIQVNESRLADYVDVLNFLWESVNEAITNELAPYTNKILDDTMAYTMHCMEKLGLLKSDKELEENQLMKYMQEQSLQHLIDQMISIWQYQIMENSGKEFEFENKYGKIIKEKFKHINGSVVKISSQNMPVYREALHYSVKGTVKNMKRYGCNELKFIWVSPTEVEKEIITILGVSKIYFSIFFTRDYSKEEIKYVLSTIGEIKDRI